MDHDFHGHSSGHAVLDVLSLPVRQTQTAPCRDSTLACANWLEWTTPGPGHGSGCQKTHHPDAGSCVGGHDNGDLTGGRLVGKQLAATYRLLQKGLPDLKTSGENQHAEAKKMLLRHVEQSP